MRTELLDYLTTNLTGSIKTSQELPWEDGGQALYLKNLKYVYLDEPSKEQEVLLPVLNGNDITRTTNTVKGFLSVDAKNRNTDMNATLASMAEAKDVNTISNSFKKEFDYTSSIKDAIQTFEFEYRFSTIT